MALALAGGGPDAFADAARNRRSLEVRHSMLHDADHTSSILHYNATAVAAAQDSCNSTLRREEKSTYHVLYLMHQRLVRGET